MPAFIVVDVTAHKLEKFLGGTGKYLLLTPDSFVRNHIVKKKKRNLFII